MLGSDKDISRDSHIFISLDTILVVNMAMWTVTSIFCFRVSNNLYVIGYHLNNAIIFYSCIINCHTITSSRHLTFVFSGSMDHFTESFAWQFTKLKVRCQSVVWSHVRLSSSSKLIRLVVEFILLQLNW